MDFFKYLPLLFRLIGHRAQIAQLIELVTPLIRDSAKHAQEITQLIKLLAPLVQEANRVAPQVQAIAVPLINDVFPEVQQMVQAAPPTVKFDVKWIQESLNEVLGSHIDVDGDLGEETKATVKVFQEKYMTPEDVDGWAGTETCAALYNVRYHKGK